MHALQLQSLVKCSIKRVDPAPRKRPADSVIDESEQLRRVHLSTAPTPAPSPDDRLICPLTIVGQGTVCFKVKPEFNPNTEYSIRLLRRELLKNDNSTEANSKVCEVKVSYNKIRIRYYDGKDLENWKTLKGASTQPVCYGEYLRPDDEKQNSESNSSSFSSGCPPSCHHQQSEIYLDHRKVPLIVTARSSYWIWVSIDRNINLIQVGVGYAMQKNVLVSLTVKTPWEDKNDGEPVPLTSLAHVNAVQFLELAQKTRLKSRKIISVPVVVDPPPKVLNVSQMSLDVIDQNTAISYLSLPQEAQRLYGAVANATLTDADAAAINYSLDTPGCALHEKLKTKEAEFGPGQDTRMVYIRVTIGQNLGQSPGVPFVMEIWPKQCFSPVHNHSNAVAIIKVLHGSINAKYFNPLCKKNDENHEESRSLAEYNFNAGDITYILPEMYQTHRLKNQRLDSACITIQCYEYLGTDFRHYEYFDYVTDPPKDQKDPPKDQKDPPKDQKVPPKDQKDPIVVKKQFKPNIDYTYSELLAIVRREYNHRAGAPKE